MKKVTWRRVRSQRKNTVAALGAAATAAAILTSCWSAIPSDAETLAATSVKSGNYPLHTGIVATTFWVGEMFDPTASDGSQVISTYDSLWVQHYGGCDGKLVDRECLTEKRSAENRYFPTSMTPLENPFYLDLPFDDVNDSAAFDRRASVVPWADKPGSARRAKDSTFSLMKNRWVQIQKGERTCYGQIQDAGPGQYNDAEYVFGADDRRPLNKKFNGAGMDVSPALNGCLDFADINGQDDRIDWRFVDAADVPPGPWTQLMTTRQLSD